MAPTFPWHGSFFVVQVTQTFFLAGVVQQAVVLVVEHGVQREKFVRRLLVEDEQGAGEYGIGRRSWLCVCRVELRVDVDRQVEDVFIDHCVWTFVISCRA